MSKYITPKKKEAIVTVVAGIPGFNHIMGKSFPLSEFKAKFPYFDPKSSCFSCEYPSKFKVGDKVKYGDRFFTVVAVDNDTTRISYTIQTTNEKYKYADITEDRLEPVKIMYIISFSGNMPIAQEMDEETFNKKFKGTAREMFCTQDLNFAKDLEQMFRSHSMFDIYQIVQEYTNNTKL